MINCNLVLNLIIFFRSAVGNDEELHNTQDVGDNLINAFSLKNLSEGRLFEPVCDYLKKMDNGWDMTCFEKNFNGFSNSMFETERLTKASNLVNNWSIALPDPEISSQFNPLSCFISLSPTADQYSTPTMNQKLVGSYLPHCPKLENETCASGDTLRRSISNIGTENPMGMDGPNLAGDNSKFYSAVPDVSCNKGINVADLPRFSSNLSKPWMSTKEAKPILKSLNLSDCKKQQALKVSHTVSFLFNFHDFFVCYVLFTHIVLKTNYIAWYNTFNLQPTTSRCNTLTSNRKGHVLANEGKKKRSEENSDTVLKKPKHENSTVPSAKVILLISVQLIFNFIYTY